MSQSPSKPAAPPPAFPFSPQDAMEFMQKMWNPLGVAIPGFPSPGAAGGAQFPNPAAMFATLDPAEIQRKIDELKIVENWLTMSVSMIQMSVKTMELQKASLEAMRAAQAAATAPPGEPHRRKS